MTNDEKSEGAQELSVRRRFLTFSNVLVFCFALFWCVLFIVNVEGHKRGYCISEGRILSDDEKIDHAVKDIIIKDVVFIRENADADLISYRLVKPFTSVADFRARYPGCCDIIVRDQAVRGRLFVNPKTWDRFWGLTYDVVQVVYDVEYYYTENDIRKHTVVDIPTVSNCCGEIVEATAGVTFSVPIKLIK